MREFTFCSFTYNQEKYLLQQLESIKFQIENFGEGITFSYLLSDDSSTDRTVEVAERWLNKNISLFGKVDIHVSERNQGIVRNYENALQNIHTDKFKILAGDDFYYKNNLFNIYGESNFVISPLVYVTDKGEVVRGNNRMVKRLLSIGEDSEAIKNTILKLFKFTGGLPAPGIFFSRQLVDDGLYEELGPFTWIEDVPEWHYLLSKPETQVKVISTPLVVYRRDFGISHKPKHPGFLKDLELLNQKYHVKRKKNNKYLNAQYYMRGLEFVTADFKSFLDSELKCRVRALKNAEKESIENEYIKEITRRATE